MSKSINVMIAQTNIAEATKRAIAALPLEHEWRANSCSDALERFRNGQTDAMFLEFGISFRVTASLDVKKKIGTSTYEVGVSQSSGLRTLSQQQASHDLMGDVLKAAHRIQAIIDALPDITA